MPAVCENGRPPCAALPQALDIANVECATVTPTARAERVSAVRVWTAASVLEEDSAVGMGTADATVASARRATTGPCVTSAWAASHHVSNTGEASGLSSWEPGQGRLAKNSCLPACSP